MQITDNVDAWDALPWSRCFSTRPQNQRFNTFQPSPLRPETLIDMPKRQWRMVGNNKMGIRHSALLDADAYLPYLVHITATSARVMNLDKDRIWGLLKLWSSSTSLQTPPGRVPATMKTTYLIAV